LIRNLNRITIIGLLNPSVNPAANELQYALVKHLTNQKVLLKGFVHPMNLFYAHSTYKSGKGIKGSQTWTPNASICDALINATELAFKGLKGFDMPIAFLVDASGSMSYAGSVSGMPGLNALDVATLLLMTFYRATANFANNNNKPMPNHVVGYFGDNTNSDIDVNIDLEADDILDKLTDVVLTHKASKFTEITNKMSNESTFDDVFVALGGGQHMGMTDVGASIWYLINKLHNSLNKVKNNDPLEAKCSVFKLPGYVELMMLITDNDVNSGDKPMSVLNVYWKLVRQAFDFLPFDKEGKKADPETLYLNHMPRFVVIATQGTMLTVGDPYDSRILNINGFDSSAPILIENFINKGKVDKTDDDDLINLNENYTD
jgi:hypothetical protein